MELRILPLNGGWLFGGSYKWQQEQCQAVKGRGRIHELEWRDYSLLVHVFDYEVISATEVTGQGRVGVAHNL